MKIRRKSQSMFLQYIVKSNTFRNDSEFLVYVCFRCSSLHQIDLRGKSVHLDGAKFIPILFWYDGTHIAR